VPQLIFIEEQQHSEEDLEKRRVERRPAPLLAMLTEGPLSVPLLHNEGRDSAAPG
jgi:hypothetical protein